MDVLFVICFAFSPDKGLTVVSDQLGLYTLQPTVRPLVVDVLGTGLKVLGARGAVSAG